MGDCYSRGRIDKYFESHYTCILHNRCKFAKTQKEDTEIIHKIEGLKRNEKMSWNSKESSKASDLTRITLSKFAKNCACCGKENSDSYCQNCQWQRCACNALKTQHLYEYKPPENSEVPQ